MSRVMSFPPFKTICPCSPVSLVPQTVTPGSAAYYMGGVVQVHTMLQFTTLA